MEKVWRQLDSGHKTSAGNIAFSQVLLTQQQGIYGGTLRFFQFQKKCILLGYYQSFEQEIREQYCLEQGIEMNRRLTGGEAVYLDDSAICWELAVGKDQWNVASETLIAMVNQAVVQGLHMLGVSAVYHPDSGIHVSGRRIAWSGGTESDECFLFQGIIQIQLDVTAMLRSLRIPTEKLINKEVLAFSDRVTCFEGLQKSDVQDKDIKLSLVKGFSQVFKVVFEKQEIQQGLYQSVVDCVSVFSSNDWIMGKKTKSFIQQERQLQGIVKAKKHTLYVSLCVDENNERITIAQFCGDFDAYPQDIIQNLEVGLQNTAIDSNSIETVVNKYINANKTYITRLTAEDFVKVILEAAISAKLTAFGAYPDEVSDLHIVVSSMASLYRVLKTELAAGNKVPFLLPYCAKLPNCRFRHREGCSICGCCDMSDAYKLAMECNLEPITIQNYEMLEAKLKELKSSGCSVFLGTCCTTFFVKHRADFEHIGLPGLLINVDNSNCYELDKEREAHQGLFENQTRLKLDLIRRILNTIKGTICCIL